MPTAQRYGALATTSWVIGIFDTAGEVSFAGMSTLTNLVFGLLLNVNRTSSRLRQQYQY
jgi:hypothetical protein